MLKKVVTMFVILLLWVILVGELQMTWISFNFCNHHAVIMLQYVNHDDLCSFRLKKKGRLC